MKLRCAWVSRHMPTKPQLRSLCAYDVRIINPPGRLWSAADALVLSQNACGGWPDLFVVVMPLSMLKTLLEKIDGRAPVVRAVVKLREDPVWTGHWEQVTCVQVSTQEWLPERKEVR